MEIFRGIKTVDGYPVIFIENLNSLVISDLHLGYELALAEQGVFVPQTQLKELLKDLREIFRKVKAENIIINGDVKHEFGEASQQEWREVKELVEYLRKKVEKIILIRGNHDNYLLNIASKIGIQVFDPYYLAKGYCFLHGHKKVKLPKDFHTLIIGHETPSLVLRRGYDKVKVPCLLYGKTKDKKNFICLPAISSWASGTEINLASKEELLSPILKEEVDFKNLIPVALEKEVGALKFPKLSKLDFSI
jgi:putative SbcD/Mre11-related phosphoesterase